VSSSCNDFGRLLFVLLRVVSIGCKVVRLVMVLFLDVLIICELFLFLFLFLFLLWVMCLGLLMIFVCSGVVVFG